MSASHGLGNNDEQTLEHHQQKKKSQTHNKTEHVPLRPQLERADTKLEKQVGIYFAY